MSLLGDDHWQQVLIGSGQTTSLLAVLIPCMDGMPRKAQHKRDEIIRRND